MTRLWLVRHGPTHARALIGWTDLPADLSDTAALARLDDFLPKDAPVVSSDLTRARQTAAALACGRALWPQMPALREMHFGQWEGLAHDEIADQALARAFWERPGDIAPPGGESWNALAGRVGAAADELAARGLPDVIVVCHMGPILTLYQRAAGISAHAALGQAIRPLSVTCLVHDGGWRAEMLDHCP